MRSTIGLNLNLVRRIYYSLAYNGIQKIKSCRHYLKVPVEPTEYLKLHFDELVKSERTLHQLAYVLNYWVFDLDIFGTHE